MLVQEMINELNKFNKEQFLSITDGFNCWCYGSNKLSVEIFQSYLGNTVDIGIGGCLDSEEYGTVEHFIQKLDKMPKNMEISFTDGFECRCYHSKNIEIKEFVEVNGAKFVDIGIGGNLEE